MITKFTIKKASSYFVPVVIKKYSKPIVLGLSALFLLIMMVVRLPDNRYCATLDLDCSWIIDGQAKLLQGVVSGRDYYFTYGPLGQIIASAGVLFRPHAAVIDRLPLLLVGFHIGTIVLLMVILACIRFVNWQTSLIIITVMFAVADFNLAMRPLISVLSVVLMARALAAPSSLRRDITFALVGAAGFLGQLVTFEIGPLIILVALCMIVVAFCSRWINSFLDKPAFLTLRQAIRTTLLVLVPYLLGNLLVSAYFKLSSSDNQGLFDYQFYSSSLARAYSHTMITPWVLDTGFAAMIIILVVYSMFIVGVEFRHMSTEHRYFYLGLGGLAILQLKSALICNDLGHVVLAVTPLLMLFLVATYEVKSQQSFRVIGVLLTLALISAPPWSGEWLKATVGAVTHPSIVREQLHMVRGFTMKPSEIVDDDLANHLAPNSRILDFPYENIIAVALGRRNVSPIIQAYSADNTLLQQYYVDQVMKVRDETEVVYCVNSAQIDGVEHITRTPLIFEYLLRNFQLKTNSLYMHRCSLLAPRPAPLDLAATAEQFQQRSNSGIEQIVFSQPSTCTLLRLKLTMTYPFTVFFGRPTPVEVQVINGSSRLPPQRVIPIEMGREFETLLYLGPSSTSYQLFDPSGKIDYAEPVSSLEIRNVSYGPFDVHPDRVQVHSLDCINMSPGIIDSVQPNRHSTVAPITLQEPVHQEFVATQPNLVGIYVKLATYARQNHGPLVLQLQQIDNTGTATKVAEQTIDMASIEDNAWKLFSFAPRASSSGQRYRLVVKALTQDQNNAVTLWMQSGDPYPAGQLTQGNKPLQGDLSFQLLYQQP